MNYNYFRDYDPGIGRYVESDPTGLWGGLNTFAYVRGAPLVHFDIWGLATNRHCQYMGYTPHPGTDVRFDEFEYPIDSGTGPFLDWTKPKCSWGKFLPPGKLRGITPPCTPEMYWEDWRLMGHWQRQLDRDYEDQDHLYVCDPECSKDDGIRHIWVRVPTGDWHEVTNEFLYAEWERGASSKKK